MIDQLLAFAEHQFSLSKAQEDGRPLREHLEKVAEIKGEPPAQLIGPPLPETLSHVWEWFLDMSGGRPVGMAGPLPLPSVEIVAWQTLRGIRLTPDEVMIIRRLDGAWLASTAPTKKTPSAEPTDAGTPTAALD